MTDPHPRIETLFNSLKDIGIGDFLISTAFKRYLIKSNAEEYWNKTLMEIEYNRVVIMAGRDYNYADSLGAFAITLNSLFIDKPEDCFGLVNDVMKEFANWKGEDLKIEELVKDLELLSAPENIIKDIRLLGNNFSKPIPKSIVPKEIWNSDKIQGYINKMDESISKSDYNLTITIAYTCLEGLFKAFIGLKSS